MNKTPNDLLIEARQAASRSNDDIAISLILDILEQLLSKPKVTAEEVMADVGFFEQKASVAKAKGRTDEAAKQTKRAKLVMDAAVKAGVVKRPRKTK